MDDFKVGVSTTAISNPDPATNSYTTFGSYSGTYQSREYLVFDSGVSPVSAQFVIVQSNYEIKANVSLCELEVYAGKNKRKSIRI